MVFRIGTVEKENGPFEHTRVLNKEECCVSAVGITLGGNLSYRECYKVFGTSQGIEKVVFIQSVVHRRRKPEYACEADFDIYLEDGRVIEVNSCYRPIVEAALKLAPKRDVRARYKAMRGR